MHKHVITHKKKIKIKKNTIKGLIVFTLEFFYIQVCNKMYKTSRKCVQEMNENIIIKYVYIHTITIQ